MQKTVFLAAFIPLQLVISGAALAGTVPTSDLIAKGEPEETQNTTECKKGQVWDKKTEECVDPKETSLSDDVLYQAVREFAYAKQYDASLGALAAMSDQQDTRVLTYRGYIARKNGDWAKAVEYYEAALAANPDNLVARSYYGTGLINSGKAYEAKAQLREIKIRGGAGSWPEKLLSKAIYEGSSDY